MENKNYLLILLVLLVLLAGGSWYYENHIIVNETDVQDEQDPQDTQADSDGVLGEKSQGQVQSGKVEDFGNSFLNNGANFINSSENLDNVSYEVFLPGVWSNVNGKISEIKMKEGGTAEYTYRDQIFSGTWRTEGYHLIINTPNSEQTFTVMFVGAERMELVDRGTGDNLDFTRVVGK